jgi:small-conductance mechanosensitive channel
MAVRSDLTVAINRKLKEAGIEIPFPQRDLHLRSADVEAARTLRGDGD